MSFSFNGGPWEVPGDSLCPNQACSGSACTSGRSASCLLPCDSSVLRMQAERNPMSTKTALEIEFKEDCTVIHMAQEYPGYTDEIKCVILTELSEAEVERKYGVLLPQYYPFLIASASIKVPIDDFNRNENKYKKRMARNTGLFVLDEEAERYHQELSVPSVEDLIAAARVKAEIRMKVRRTLGKLPEAQRRRLVKHYVQKKTWKEISQEEGCTDRAIGYSIQTAKKNYLKIWKKDFLKGTPLSKHDEGVYSMLGAIASSIMNKGEVV